MRALCRKARGNGTPPLSLRPFRFAPFRFATAATAEPPTPAPMNPLLNIAVKAAREAGKTLLRHADRLERITVEVKGPGDFVSAVDRMAEDDIVDIVRARYPNHRIIAEERGIVEAAAAAAGDANADAKTNTKAAAGKDIEWLIDPLDGTTNYLHGHPHFAVSIAACEGGQAQHAVIYDPLRDEMFTASRGQGAHLNRRRIRVTQQRRMKRCLLATGVHYHGDGDRHGRARFEAWQRCFDSLLPRAVDIRRGGSAALDLAYIACGRLDGYWQPGLAAWDAAAGALLVREAGGFVADFQGGQRFLDSGEIIASNPLIFNELLVTVSGALEVDGGGESTPANADAAAPAADKKAAAGDAKSMRKTATAAKLRVKKVTEVSAKSSRKPAKTATKTGAKTAAKKRAKPRRKTARKTVAAKPARA